jgi:hypothetical protein
VYGNRFPDEVLNARMEVLGNTVTQPKENVNLPKPVN